MHTCNYLVLCKTITYFTLLLTSNLRGTSLLVMLYLQQNINVCLECFVKRLFASMGADK